MIVHPFLLIAVAIATTGTAADPWLSQKALARKAGLSLTDRGKDGKPLTLPVRHLVYSVVAEDGDRIRVNYPGQEGWAAKSDWVRLADAMEHFSGRVKDDPKDAFAWSRRGIANRYAGKPDLALKDLEEAVRLAPKDSDLVGIRGMMWWANKNLDKAIADYTESCATRSDICGRLPEPWDGLAREGRVRQGNLRLQRSGSRRSALRSRTPRPGSHVAGEG